MIMVMKINKKKQGKKFLYGIMWKEVKSGKGKWDKEIGRSRRNGRKVSRIVKGKRRRNYVYIGVTFLKFLVFSFPCV
jgi:hypothetical protein